MPNCRSENNPDVKLTEKLSVTVDLLALSPRIAPLALDYLPGRSKFQKVHIYVAL